MPLLSLSDWGPLDSNRLIHHLETQSTNHDAFLAASKGAATGTWIIADQQTEGKGRSNRRWISLRGNLHASIILKHIHQINKIPELSLVAGLAFHHTVLELANHLLITNVEIKWPNDLLINRKKVGGILIESTCYETCDGATAIVGFGLNLLCHPEFLYENTSCLRSFGISLEPLDFLKSLDHHFLYWLALWSEDEGLTRIRDEWMAASLPIGTSITTRGLTGSITGSFRGISEEGFLIIKNTQDQLETICFGDVTVSA